MSQPLDFSSGARKPVAPPPPNRKGSRRPSRPAPAGGAGKKRALILLALLVLVVGGGYLAFVVFDVFGRDDGRGTAAGDARFCQLVGQLDQVSLSTGAASSTGTYDGPPEKIKAALDQMGSALQDLRSVAPKPVSRDQGVVVDALKQAAGGNSSRVKAPDFTQASQRIHAYAGSHCPRSTGGDDG